jgi:ParB family chromosome partitioning protein
LVRKDQLSYGHARALVDHPQAEVLAHEIIDKGMSVRQAEMLVLRQPKKKAQATARQPTPDLDALTDSIARETGYQVRILMNRRGGGAMTIKFANLMQLEELVEKIRRDVGMSATAD